MKYCIIFGITFTLCCLGFGMYRNDMRDSYIQGCTYAAFNIIRQAYNIDPPVNVIVNNCTKIYNETH